MAENMADLAEDGSLQGHVTERTPEKINQKSPQQDVLLNF